MSQREPQPEPAGLWSTVPLWIAQAFGVGRIQPGPGTWGSLVGLIWFVFLISFDSALWFALGAVLGVLLSIWSCGRAEKILGEKDPSSVVMDEICAVPLCFVSWMALAAADRGGFPGGEYFIGDNAPWLLIALVFVSFRVFDIAKPWPLRQSQSLPGGWGVTVDDLLAAACVNVVVLALWAIGLWKV